MLLCLHQLSPFLSLILRHHDPWNLLLLSLLPCLRLPSPFLRLIQRLAIPWKLLVRLLLLPLPFSAPVLLLNCPFLACLPVLNSLHPFLLYPLAVPWLYLNHSRLILRPPIWVMFYGRARLAIQIYCYLFLYVRSLLLLGLSSCIFPAQIFFFPYLLVFPVSFSVSFPLFYCLFPYIFFPHNFLRCVILHALFLL